MAIKTPTDAVVKNSQLKQYEPAEEEFSVFVSAVETFKSEIEDDRKKVYSNTQVKVREAFYEKIISDLLNSSFYNKTNYVGKPKNGDIDLVILDEKSSKSKLKVIIEVKSVDNKAEFPKPDGSGGFDINCKALQETVLYYLRESVSNTNYNPQIKSYPFLKSNCTLLRKLATAMFYSFDGFLTAVKTSTSPASGMWVSTTIPLSEVSK
ncbi:MAG: hypothetical protein IJP72_01030 [Bacteroidales bacterium]|nr:hypothetical protein [Bacteroidales bacterium]